MSRSMLAFAVDRRVAHRRKGGISRNTETFQNAQVDGIVAHVHERHREFVSTHANHQRHHVKLQRSAKPGLGWCALINIGVKDGGGCLDHPHAAGATEGTEGSEGDKKACTVHVNVA
mmetsp:Transcript_5027/g.32033  ORF Transcript_5027/g.32033 Transcript_5027/m.32033 type:complete len:117 (+) Transcript_5027:2970-3320(+)